MLGGPLDPSPRLKAEAVRADLVVAADRGILHAEALGLRPDLWVGDFDSSPETLRTRYPDLPQEAHPRDKDATDGELAARAAIRRGARALLLAGALSGEVDHTLAHHALALGLAEQGIEVALTDGRSWAWPVVPPGVHLNLPPGTPFSLVPFAPLKGVRLEGGRWQLRGENLPLGTTRATRNVATGPVRIELAAGRSVLVARLA